MFECVACDDAVNIHINVAVHDMSKVMHAFPPQIWITIYNLLCGTSCLLVAGSRLGKHLQAG